MTKCPTNAVNQVVLVCVGSLRVGHGFGNVGRVPFAQSNMRAGRAEVKLDEPRGAVREV